jgi:hypothetical protein
MKAAVGRFALEHVADTIGKLQFHVMVTTTDCHSVRDARSLFGKKV